MRTGLAVALLCASAALAGCSGGGTGAGEALPQATAATGALRGVVVDEAIRPLANASVAVALADGAERSAASDADGAWSLGGLPPGAYLVRSAKRGYLDAQVAANVTAGADGPPGLRIVLVADPASAPAVDAYLFDGFLQCSATAVAARAAACNPREAASPLCPLPGSPCQALGNLTDDRFMAVHTLARGGLAFLQSEMQWDPSTGLGSSLRAVPGSRSPEDGGIDDFQAFEGPSPLVMPMDGGVANGLRLGNGRDYVVRAFSGYAEGTAPPCLPNPVGCQWGVGVAFQQRFQLVTHAFYGYAPPEGWQFGRDGMPASPP